MARVLGWPTSTSATTNPRNLAFSTLAPQISIVKAVPAITLEIAFAEGQCVQRLVKVAHHVHDPAHRYGAIGSRRLCITHRLLLRHTSRRTITWMFNEPLQIANA